VHFTRAQTGGSGLDQVLVDSKDMVASDCENVSFSLASEEAFFETIPQSFFKKLPPPPKVSGYLRGRRGRQSRKEVRILKGSVSFSCPAPIHLSAWKRCAQKFAGRATKLVVWKRGGLPAKNTKITRLGDTHRFCGAASFLAWERVSPPPLSGSHEERKNG
jgi:hypothetical protein